MTSLFIRKLGGILDLVKLFTLRLLSVFHLTKRSHIHLSIQNWRGSVEHYYHFLLGFLLPFVRWYHCESGKNYERIAIRSCGVMDRHIESLCLPNLVIMDKEVHSKHAPRACFSVRIRGFDSPLKNFSRQLRQSRGILIDLLGLGAADSAGTVFDDSRERMKVLMIKRGEPDPFYHSNECEIKTAGSQRRSIPNFDELVQSIGHLHPDVVLLEDATLQAQISMFQAYDLIIAKHGAALANLVFCKRGASVIEVCPLTSLDMFASSGDYFQAISSQMGLKLFRVFQDHAHAPVEVSAFVSTVHAVCSLRH